MLEKLILITLITLITSVLCATGYKLPPENVREIYARKGNPYLQLLTRQGKALEFNYQQKQNLSQLTEPLVELAGKKLSKRLNAPLENYPTTSINIVDLLTKVKTKIQLPENAKIRETSISPDYSKIALSNETENGIIIIIADLKTGKITTYDQYKINDCFGNGGFSWKRNSTELIVYTIPKNRGLAPVNNNTPTSPIMDETSGKKSSVRTYQNLLSSPEDERLFDYYFTSEIRILNVKKDKWSLLDEAKIYNGFSPSPDGNYFLVTTIERPYSYLVPYYYFPKQFSILDKKGNLVKEFYKRPMQDQIPIGGTYTGPRGMSWQPMKDAALIWQEALDNGDPKVETEYRDIVYRLDNPNQAKPEVLTKSKFRFAGLEYFNQEDLMFAYEYDREKLWSYCYLLNAKTKEKELIEDKSVNDVYNDLGSLSYIRTKRNEFLNIIANDWVIYNNTRGATPKGNFPEVFRYNIKTKEKESIFKCDENKYEYARGFSDNNNLLIASEDKNSPRNYYLYDINSNEKQIITNYPNPYPEITELKKELIQYKRKDGIQLSGTLYLPAGYKIGDKLPLVLHAYPEEYADKSTAGQISGSPNKFTSFWGASIKYFCLQGYAVLMNASMPIVGNPETVNDTFITQLEDNVAAAIDYLDSKEIIDPKKVGIVGHSYGAFMVANILAHTDLCAAGIAKSGAYNRTLTPFGFQSERRTFWEAKDFYMKVSPFANADKINEPLLLIHGEKDPNSGTFPIQSKRLFHAIKGNGGNARLVILPLEGHSYVAEESQLHVLAEMIEWFDRYLKK